MGRTLLDRAGQRFGRLVVISRAEGRRMPCGSKRTMWLCECDCGTRKEVGDRELMKGSTISCGCRLKEKVTTHGGCGTPEYKCWASMKMRCLQPSQPAYKFYGAKGITIAPEWRDFSAFLRDMGPRPSPHHSLDRIDGTLGYGPNNCRWATRQQQSENRSNTIWINYKGERVTVSEAARRSGVAFMVIRQRMKAGWPEELWTAPAGSVYRSTSVLVDYEGERLPVTEVSRRTGISRHTIRNRMRNGWPKELWLIPATGPDRQR